MMTTIFRYFSLVCVFIAYQSPVIADTIPANQDAFVYRRQPLQNFGNDATIQVSSWNNIPNFERRGYFSFDLSLLSETVSIESAQLKIYVNDVRTPGAISVHHVLESWNDATMNWLNAAQYQSQPLALLNFNLTQDNSYRLINVTALLQDILGNNGDTLSVALVPFSGFVRVDFGSKDSNNANMFAELLIYTAGGVPGERGPEGPEGLIGPDGDKGIRGEPGPQGPQGEPGPKGETGEKGPTGPQGEPGRKGEKGDRGEQGIVGEQGPVGPAGADGTPGADGRFCWDLNGNGVRDQLSEDTNNDGFVDIHDCVVGNSTGCDHITSPIDPELVPIGPFCMARTRSGYNNFPGAAQRCIEAGGEICGLEQLIYACDRISAGILVWGHNNYFTGDVDRIYNDNSSNTSATRYEVFYSDVALGCRHDFRFEDSSVRYHDNPSPLASAFYFCCYRR